MVLSHAQKSKIDELEEYLQIALKPVAPRSDFVRSLKQRLVDNEAPTVSYPGRIKTDLLLLIAASLLSSTFLLLTGSRLVLAILGAFGLLQQFRRKAQEEPLVAPETVV